MRLLLDTCALLWLTAEPNNLSSDAIEAIEHPGAKIHVSDASVWELCLKWQSGKIQLPQPPRTWIEAQRNIWLFDSVQIEKEHLYRTSELPTHHRDPFDRMLVAQAIEERLQIITPDAEIKKYPVAGIW